MDKGTIPKKESVESSREQRPRTMHGAIIESNAGRGSLAVDKEVRRPWVEYPQPPLLKPRKLKKGVGR